VKDGLKRSTTEDTEDTEGQISGELGVFQWIPTTEISAGALESLFFESKTSVSSVSSVVESFSKGSDRV
jgi:hypothetical protein